MASALAAATTAGIVFHALVVENVDALPSFGTRVPNGERVPCPKPITADNGEDDPRTTGCTRNGFCFGLGHLQCGGFNPNAAIPVDGTDFDADGNAVSATNETETEQNIFQLNVFGEDWKLNGFVWTKELCELDSDGDGFTNGEELGDPCCVWSTDIGHQHDLHPLLLNNKAGFVPSHPGLEDQVPEGLWDDMEDKATFCSNYNEDEATAEEDGANDATAVQDEIPPILENTDNTYNQYLNEGEPWDSFEFRIKPYPIPIQTTTYVDFVFNLPDNLPDIVHLVHAETLISQPEHLHHYVLNGCTTRFDPEDEGVPIDDPSRNCNMRLGGWSPGMKVLGTPSFDTGFAIGPGMGVVAIQINIHYTDGVYADPETKTQKMATDGLRFIYTTKFRPYTSLTKSLIFVPFGPMSVPANESRYFMSRKCNVETYCKDSSPEQLQTIARVMDLDEMEGIPIDNSIIDNLTCPMTFPFCFSSSPLAYYAQRLCPMTCGLCGGEDNPRNPDQYRIGGITYHAHLLGTEMYATLLHEEESGGEPENLEASQKQAQVPPSVEARMIAKDLKSREIWHYDDQAPFAMDYDIVIAGEEETAASGASGLVEGTTITTRGKTLQRGVEVKAGDKIQVTCVYDSTTQTEDTRFGFSTYEEMCIISVDVRFPTPASFTSTGELGDSLDSKINKMVDLNLRSFYCAQEDTESFSSDVYQGFLAENQDGRNIWYEHPVEDTEMCTYPIHDFIIVDNILTLESRNCPEGSENDNRFYDKEGLRLCEGFSAMDGDNDGGDMTNDLEVKLLEDAIAGYTCSGGAFDGLDGNEEFDDVSRDKCLNAGGSSYEPYTCSDAQWWMRNESSDQPGAYDYINYVRTVWQPMCCSLVTVDDANIQESEDTDEEDTTSELWSSASSAQGGVMLKFLFTVVLSTILAMTF